MFYSKVELPVTVFLEDGEESAPFAEFSLPLELNNNLCDLVGMNIVLSSRKTVVETESTSVFDLLQNLWSLMVICFAVMLAKAARYINSRLMEQRMGNVRAEFRNNLCILLSKVHAMAAGKQHREIQKAKYYLKT
jgi:hypothetical protein